MKTAACFLLAVAMLASPASAQTVPHTATAGTQPSPALVKHFLEVSGMRETVQRMLQGMNRQAKDAALQEFDHKLPNANEQQRQSAQKFFGDLFDEQMSIVSVDEMLDIVSPIYQKHFTRADMQGLIAFYESPLGKKMLHETPAMMDESMTASGQLVRQRLDDFQKKLDDRIDAFVKQMLSDDEKERDKGKKVTPPPAGPKT